MTPRARFIVMTSMAFAAAFLYGGTASATTFVVTAAGVSDLYSAFSRADGDINNTYEIHLNQGTYTLFRPASNDPGDKNSRTTGCLKLKYGHVVLVGGGYDENTASNYVIDGGWNSAPNSHSATILCVGPDSDPSTFHPTLEVRGVLMQNSFGLANHATINASNADLKLLYCHVSNSRSHDTPGAALYAYKATVTITASYFENSVTEDYATDTCGGQFDSGGNIYAASSSLYMSYSSLIFGKSCRGGGIFFDSVTGNTLSVQNSTIAMNEAQHLAGGMFIRGPGTVSLLFNTITANHAAESSLGDGSQESRYGGGIGFTGFTGRLIMRGNIIAGNITPPLNEATNPPSGFTVGVNNGDDCFHEGSFTASSNITFNSNVLGKQGNCTFAPVGRLVGANSSPIDPRLGYSDIVPRVNFTALLFMYDGLQPGSVALGAATSCLGDDERGAARVSTGCDIGAYQTNCPHDLCLTGRWAPFDCDQGSSCAADVCSNDPHCCSSSSSWDSTCVAEVPQYCGVTCP